MSRAEFIAKEWQRTSGFFLLVRIVPNEPRLYARTRSAETAARLLTFGFLGADCAWKLYRSRVRDFDLYV